MPDVEVLGRNVSIARLPRDARDRTLPGRYGEIYHSMLDQALAEFPPIEGYETMHVMMMERAIYFFVKQKAQEDQPIQAFDLKSYRVNFLAFIKSCRFRWKFSCMIRSSWLSRDLDPNSLSLLRPELSFTIPKP
jgi:hypothetical protein